MEELSAEAKTLFNKLKEFTVTSTEIVNINENKIDTVTIVYAKFSGKISSTQRKVLNEWLKARTKSNNIKLIVE